MKPVPISKAKALAQELGVEAVDDLRPYINSLCEPGASWACGAWCDGHQDVAAFALAVRDEFRRSIIPADVRHGYARRTPRGMHFTTIQGRGASPATWAGW